MNHTASKLNLSSIYGTMIKKEDSKMNQNELYCRTCEYQDSKPGENPCKRCIAEGWDRKQLSLYESEDHLSEAIRKEIESFIEKQIKRIEGLKKKPFNASDIYHNLALEKAIIVLRNSI